jgi:hypothetical protein
MTFYHGAHDVPVASGDLRGDILSHDQLTPELFGAVTVTEINHQLRR